jgi:cell division protein FtsA
MVAITPVGSGDDEAPMQLSRATLTRIIRPRIEEILSVLRDRLQATGMMDLSGKRLVITGGGSEMTGLPELARRIVARNVRQGRPLGISGLPPMAKGPAFSTVVGMLIYPQVCAQEMIAPRVAGRLTGTDGYLSRVTGWLKSGF